MESLQECVTKIVLTIEPILFTEEKEKDCLSCDICFIPQIDIYVLNIQIQKLFLSLGKFDVL